MFAFDRIIAVVYNSTTENPTDLEHVLLPFQGFHAPDMYEFLTADMYHMIVGQPMGFLTGVRGVKPPNTRSRFPCIAQTKQACSGD